VLTNNTASDVDVVLATPDWHFKVGPANVYAGTNYTSQSQSQILDCDSEHVIPSDVLLRT